MQNIMLMLAGVEYQVEPLKVRQAKQFRQKIGAQLSGLTDLIAGALRPTTDAVRVDDLAGLADMIGEVGQTLSQKLIGSTDLVADLLFEYSPALAEDRERIEEEAYDDEIIAAFLEVLKLLYPFGGMAAIFQSGPAARRT